MKRNIQRETHVSTYLIRPEKEKSSIMFSITYLGKRVQISSGEVIETKFWDFKESKVNREYQYFADLNHNLNEMKISIDRFIRENIRTKQKIDNDIIKEFVKKCKNPEYKNKDEIQKEKENEVLKLSLLEQFRNFIELRKNSNVNRLGTIKRLTTSLNHIQSFEKYKNDTLTYDMINLQFANELFIYLTQKETLHKKKLTNHSASTVLQNLKTFLKYAYENKFAVPNESIKNINDSLKNFQVNGEKENINAICIEKDELTLIENNTLLTEKLQRIRDLFLVQCYTGIRFSDLIQLSSVNFDLSNELISITQYKTGNKIQIPIHLKLKNILKKYEPEFNFPKLSNQKYNDYLKELCKQCEINMPCEIIQKYGKNQIKTVLPKYEIVSSHTGRRTFITLSLKANILPEIIMKVSGHKDRKSFQKYVRIAQERAIETVKNVWNEL